MRSAIARSPGFNLEPAQLVVQVILQATGAGRSCWPWHRACVRRPPRSRRARRMAAFLEVVRPLLVHLHQIARNPARSSGFRRSPARVLLRCVRRAVRAARRPRISSTDGVRGFLGELEHRILFHLLLDPFLRGRGWATGGSPSTGSSAAPAPASERAGGLAQVIIA